ncbi:MAG TPA: non-ribosomal peptide synthetase, partial [Thermoanaerobaculia bacterium]|nr:non-ribosomal peptide synthetase [Thermoanaerobaculia bacterium]
GVEVELRPPADGAAEGLGRGLAPGEGEVWVRGANVMSGYYRNPEATAAVMSDGWLNTGDVGHFDADGYLHLSGRTKEVIVTGAGKNVYPEEVELRYRDLPGVEELVVLGLPGRGDGEGEVVAAVVVPAADVDEEAVRAAVDERAADVPSYQRVARLEVWHGELPKTTTLKVQRARLAAAILAGERGGDQGGDQDGGGKAAQAPAAAPPQSEGEEWAIATVARLTRGRADQLTPDDRLADLGVDSLTRVELVGEIEARRGGRLDESVVARLERVRDVSDLA